MREQGMWRRAFTSKENILRWNLNDGVAKPGTGNGIECTALEMLSFGCLLTLKYRYDGISSWI